MKTRSAIVELARSWIGKNEADGSYKSIIDIYNTHTPYARGVKMQYNWEWCACTWSALAIELGYTDIIPLEISCSKLIELAKEMGIWQEDDAYVPAPGDGIIYDWQDSGSGDNQNSPDHIGIVEDVSNGIITVIEGNYSNSVKRRTVAVNGKYIRGFICPKYDEEATKEPEATVYVPSVKEWQKAATADGYSFPKYGEDGVWGAECVSVAKKAIVKKRATYTNKNLTRIVQRVVGVTADGLCGKNTDAAIKAWQKKNGLTADGAVGINSWKKILGV